jgi:hypothetical protein
MSVKIYQTKTALGAGYQASFKGAAGVPPYSYTVETGGAGGTIDRDTGIYTAPAKVPTDPRKYYDTIDVRDSLGVHTTARILVGDVFHLFREILQRELEITDDKRIYFWDQKIFQPEDAGLFLAISVSPLKPFANRVVPLEIIPYVLDGNGNRVVDNAGNPVLSGPVIPASWDGVAQIVNMSAILDINIISRDTSARDRMHEVVMALLSPYSEFQQGANAFHIGRIPTNFTNLWEVDGAAIPYRYVISVRMQYAVIKTSGPDFYDKFREVEVAVNS